ncbi:hypothetical protein RchiOBHm_Chr5g0061831 [Rosa chinensis]|uniref:Secreted protein n=1 Tax=Rosa chinensis TaxID=74649 RepID=A0A2P6QI11_ROSCH|nr:hypothetical protein RchiOBHm_Chr5g0061831 [Rosa chinensis]
MLARVSGRMGGRWFWAASLDVLCSHLCAALGLGADFQIQRQCGSWGSGQGAASAEPRGDSGQRGRVTKLDGAFSSRRLVAGLSRFRGGAR